MRFIYLQFIALFLIALAALTYLRGDSNLVEDPRILVYAVGVLLAAVTFLLSQDLKARQSRKQHTIKILFEARLSEGFRELLRERRLHFASHSPVDMTLYTLAAAKVRRSG